jgi:hypothetical protein
LKRSAYFTDSNFMLFLLSGGSADLPPWRQSMGKTRLMAEETHPPVTSMGLLPKARRDAQRSASRAFSAPRGTRSPQRLAPRWGAK